jgi:hypothetical protein
VNPLATSSGPPVNDEFVRLAETAMGELNNGIEELEAASSDANPDIQAALDEQIEVLQEQQQAASNSHFSLQSQHFRLCLNGRIRSSGAK